MEPLIGSLDDLTKEFHSLKPKDRINFNVLSSKVKRLNVFQLKLAEALQEKKSTSNITEVVNQMVAFVDNDKVLNDDEEKNHLKFLIANAVLHQLNSRSLFEIDLSESFQFSKFLDLILSQFDAFPKTALELILLIFKFDCNLLAYEKLDGIFSKVISSRKEIDTSASLIYCKNEIILSLVNLCAVNRNLLRFHECFFTATRHTKREDVLFEQSFIQLYCEKIFELNWASIHKIWKFFIENFQRSNYGMIKLFGLFLSHIKVLDNKMVELNRTSLDEIMTETSMLLRDFTLKHERFLSIYHSLACLHFILQTYTDKSNPVTISSNLYDLSDIFTATSSSQWQEFYDNFDILQDDQKLIIVKLMLVKYKFVKISLHDDSISKSLMQVISKIVCHKILIRFDILHFLVAESDQHCTTLMVEHLIENMFDENHHPNSQIRQIFSLSSTWENPNFQSVFITCFIKRLEQYFCQHKRKNSDDSSPNVSTIMHHLVSKEKLWVKYGNVMPDSKADKYQKVLALIKSACDSFEARQYTQEVEVTNVRSLLELVTIFSESVPLEHLYPLNQLRCILALSNLLVSLKGKPKEKAKLINLFVTTNLHIWNSIRSIWLFDFMSPAEYVNQMLFHLQSSLDDRCYILFNCYISNLFRLFDCEQSHRNVCALIETLNQNEFQVKVEYIFMIQTMILRNNAQFVKKMDNKPKFAPYLDQFTQIGKNISSLIYKNIKVYLDASDSFDRLDSQFVVEGLTKLFEYNVFTSLASAEESTLKNKWKKLLFRFISFSLDNLSSSNVKKSFINFLRVVVLNRERLNFALSESFILDLWEKIVQLDFGASSVDCLLKKLSSSSHWKKVHQNEKIYRKFVQLQSESIERSKENVDQQLVCSDILLDAIRPLLVPLAESSNGEEFGQIIHSCSEALCQSSIARSAYFLSLLQQILKANLSFEKCRLLSSNFVSILTSLISLTFLCNKPTFRNDNQVQACIRMGALEVGQALMSHLTGHDLLTNSHIFLVYNLCTEINMVQHSSNLCIFPSLFLKVNRILFELLNRRPHLAIFSMCSQLNILTTMLVSLLKASEEANFLNATDQEKINVENCSKSFSQTLTQLSNMDDFKPYAVHLIALYLQHSPNYSVVYFVKKNLTVGIFNLIDLIKDKEMIERLYSRLGQGSREVLKGMLEHYDKYHRFKGYV